MKKIVLLTIIFSILSISSLANASFTKCYCKTNYIYNTNNNAVLGWYWVVYGRASNGFNMEIDRQRNYMQSYVKSGGQAYSTCIRALKTQFPECKSRI